jgi:menaquinone-dependent protoporphyrinogen oxidase
MKILIIYGTNYGTSEKVAKMIKSKIDDVDIINIKKVSKVNFDLYGKIVIGAGIKIGQIPKMLKTWINSNLNELNSKKLYLYLCAASTKKEELNKQWTLNFSQELLEKAVYKTCVGWELDYENLNFFEKGILKIVKGQKESISRLKENEIDKLASFLKES